MATALNERMVGEFWQGADEGIVYGLVVTGWGSTPSSVTAKIFRESTTGTPVDVSTTSFAAGSPTVNGDSITLPKISALSQDENYRVEIKFTAGGQDYEAWLKIHGQR